jgi:hypothetical protein
MAQTQGHKNVAICGLQNCMDTLQHSIQEFLHLTNAEVRTLQQK